MRAILRLATNSAKMSVILRLVTNGIEKLILRLVTNNTRNGN